MGALNLNTPGWGLKDFSKDTHKLTSFVDKRRKSKRKKSRRKHRKSIDDNIGADDDELNFPGAYKQENFVIVPAKEPGTTSSSISSDLDVLLPDPDGFRQIAAPKSAYETRLPTSLPILCFSPSTVASIATTPTSSPDASPIFSPSSSPESPSCVPISRLSLVDLENLKPALRTKPIEPKKHKKRVDIDEDRNKIRCISPAPLLDGEETNFYKKKSARERELMFDEDMDYEGEQETIFDIDWDALLDVAELLEMREKSKSDR